MAQSEHTMSQFVGVPKPEEQSRREHHATMEQSAMQNREPNRDRMEHAKEVLANSGHMDCSGPSY